MIDPIETLLNLFRADVALLAATDGRIATQHKFMLNDNAAGRAWPLGTAVCVQSTTDAAATTAGILSGRATITAFGPTPRDAQTVWGAVDMLCRYDGRRTVLTSRGVALVYSVALDLSPSAAVDAELGICFLQGSARYQIFMEAVA